MRRKGMGMALRLVVVGLVLLVLALIISGGAYTNIGNFNIFADNSIRSSELNTCANNVKGFCDDDENTGLSWVDRYAECAQFESEISETVDSVDGTSCR